MEKLGAGHGHLFVNAPQNLLGCSSFMGGGRLGDSHTVSSLIRQKDIANAYASDASFIPMINYQQGTQQGLLYTFLTK